MTQMTVVNQNNLTAMTNIKPMLEFATHLVKSGFLPTAVNTAEKALAIILTGNELGIPPMQALRQIHVIQGKPTMSVELMLGLAYSRIPGFICEVLESNNAHCVVKMSRPNHTPYTHTFTMEDARNLGLTGKDNWKKQPAVMLRWRCISAALKVVAPDAISGLYTPEELNPDVHVNYETGEVIDNQATRATQSTQAQLEPPPSSFSPEIEQSGGSNGSSEECISEAQQRLIFVMLKKHGVEADFFKSHVVETYHVQHTDEIKKKDMQTILKWIETNAKVQ